MTPKDRERLTHAVEEAESHCAAEVVLVGYARADAYLDIAFRNALGATLFVVAVVLLAPFDVPHEAVLPVVVLCALGTFFMSRMPAVARWTSTTSRRVRAIDAAVAQAFLSRGVHKTRGRTGLLVTWFELEQATRVVFDSGLEARVPVDVRTQIVKELMQGCAGSEEARAQAVAALGQQLQPFVPRGADDVDELHNAPSVGGAL